MMVVEGQLRFLVAVYALLFLISFSTWLRTHMTEARPDRAVTNGLAGVMVAFAIAALIASFTLVVS